MERGLWYNEKKRKGSGRAVTRSVRERLQEKRKATEIHIRQLQREGKAGVRYTAMMPDVPFLVCGLLSDVGWMIHLVAGVCCFCRNGIRYPVDYTELLALVLILVGVGYLIHLNRIHEKEIATKLQKDLGFGLTIYSGLAGAAVAILQILFVTDVSAEFVWMAVGGLLNFAAGLPIYLSFRKGIFYGVK